MHELEKAGLIETQRGRGGGFRLGRPTGEVSLTKGPVELVECFNRVTNTCPLIGICKLSRTFAEAMNAFLDVFGRVTIPEIAAKRDQLLDRILPLQEGIVTPQRVRA